ncbi:MAG: flippase-like domain-containing protein [Deltaproteobacteria bacterium]|nr:flippase-like domain-containing protein [Deltaproteobacteria bacterium]
MTQTSFRAAAAALAESFRQRKSWRALFSAIVVAAIFTVLIASGGWSELRAALAQTRLEILLAAVLLHLGVSFAGNPTLWRTVLRYLGIGAPAGETYRLWNGMYCLRVVLPARAGSFVVGPNYLRTHHGVPFSRGVGSFALTYFLNFYCQWFFLAAGLLIVGAPGGPLPALLAALLFATPWIMTWFRAPAGLAVKFHARLGEILTRLLGAFSDIPIARRLRLFALAIGVQFIDVVVTWLCLRAAGIAVPFPEVMWRASAVTLAAALPVTTMGLGTREAAMVYFFSPFAGGSNALAAGLLLSFTMEIVPAALSMFFFPSVVTLGLAAPEEITE